MPLHAVYPLCASAKGMQFFGARANLAKCLLYAINGGVDEISDKQVGPKYRPDHFRVPGLRRGYGALYDMMPLAVTYM